jgi:hypothetical protein
MILTENQERALQALRWDGQFHAAPWIAARGLGGWLPQTTMQTLVARGLAEKRSLGYGRPQWRITAEGRRLLQARDWHRAVHA